LDLYFSRINLSPTEELRSKTIGLNSGNKLEASMFEGAPRNTISIWKRLSNYTKDLRFFKSMAN